MIWKRFGIVKVMVMVFVDIRVVFVQCSMFMFVHVLFHIDKCHGKDHDHNQGYVNGHGHGHGHGHAHLEEHAEEEHDPVEERGEVLVEGPALQGGVVGGEAPGQAGEGRYFTE